MSTGRGAGRRTRSDTRAAPLVALLAVLVALLLIAAPTDAQEDPGTYWVPLPEADAWEVLPDGITGEQLVAELLPAGLEHGLRLQFLAGQDPPVAAILGVAGAIHITDLEQRDRPSPRVGEMEAHHTADTLRMTAPEQREVDGQTVVVEPSVILQITEIEAGAQRLEVRWEQQLYPDPGTGDGAELLARSAPVEAIREPLGTTGTGPPEPAEPTADDPGTSSDEVPAAPLPPASSGSQPDPGRAGEPEPTTLAQPVGGRVTVGAAPGVGPLPMLAGLLVGLGGVAVVALGARRWGRRAAPGPLPSAAPPTDEGATWT